MLFVFVGCNHNEDYLVIKPVEKEQRAIVDGKVPLSRAISNADFVFKNTEEFGCKSRKIKSVDVLTKSKTNSIVTRSSLQDE